MIAQVLLKDKKYQKSLSVVMEKLEVVCHYSNDTLKFKEDSLKFKPDIFFIQAGVDDSRAELNLVSDIRDLFGSIVTIIILGDEITQKAMSIFLAEGADQFFSFPFDLSLIEDFLSKRTETSFYNAFKYRNIPSRSTEVKIKFDVALQTLNSKGVCLLSSHLIKNGTVLNLDLREVSPNLAFEIKILTTHSIQLDVNKFEVHGIYFEMNENIESLIIHEIRN